MPFCAKVDLLVRNDPVLLLWAESGLTEMPIARAAQPQSGQSAAPLQGRWPARPASRGKSHAGSNTEERA